MKIGEFNITDGKVFIIAELSANHNGSIDTALRTIEAAKEVGANAIKLQTYTADTITLDSKKNDFIIKGTIWEGQNLYNLYKKAHTPWEWHEALFEKARSLDLICFSSPFDLSAVDFLEKLDVPAYKIASFEITDIPLIEYAASKGKPMIISTGIAREKDINLALEACRKMGNDQIILLKCTSSYPAPIEEANLLMISDFRKRFNVIPGLSDHTTGNTAPIVATTLGARVIEKHFILNKQIGGPDASFSLDKEEFKAMVEAVRITEKSIGKVDYTLTPKQIMSRDYARSLYISENIKKGEILTHNNLRSIRLGYGCHPKHLNEALGKSVNRDLEMGTPFKLDYIK